MKHIIKKYLVALILCSVSKAVLAKEVLEIQGMSVKGNAEQPKVLYLVPWQATSRPQDITNPPTEKVQGAITFIEPEYFQKHLYFKNNLRVNVEPIPKN